MVAEICALHIQSCIMFLDVYTYGKALYILKNAEFLFTYLEISIVLQRTILQMQLAYALIQVDITQTF